MTAIRIDEVVHDHLADDRIPGLAYTRCIVHYWDGALPRKNLSKGAPSGHRTEEPVDCIRCIGATP